jgi:hypothetical protein
VSRITAVTGQLRALGDLAQRSSLQVRLRGTTVGVAFGNGKLLAELLRTPDDPYALEVQGDALLVYRADAQGSAQVVRSCLRP